MKKLIALTQFTSPVVGTILSGSEFTCDDDLAKKYIDHGVAEESAKPATKKTPTKKVAPKKAPK